MSKKPQTVIAWITELLQNWETMTYVQVRGKTILLKDADERVQAGFIHDRLKEFRKELREEAANPSPTAEDHAEAADAD